MGAKSSPKTNEGARALLRSATTGDRVEGLWTFDLDRLADVDRSLIRAALDDPDPVVRDSAASIAGRTLDAEVLPKILSNLERTPPRLAWSSAWAVAEIVEAGRLADSKPALEALRRYQARSRGRSRAHADVLLERLDQVQPSAT